MRLDHLLSMEKTERRKISGYPVSQGKGNLILFNFEAPGLKRRESGTDTPNPERRGCSSAGRAPALHAGGQEFDPHLHQG